MDTMEVETTAAGAGNKSVKSVPLHGNYTNYYAKRQSSHQLDPRLALLPPAYLLGKDVLDLGCNTGFISLQLIGHCKAKSVVGVDIDEGLITRARLGGESCSCIYQR